jgi:predicted permease
MIRDVLTVGGSVITLFLLMAVGFVLAKLQVLTKPTLGQMSRMLMYVVCPAIMIDILAGENRNWATVRVMLIAGAVLVGTYALNMILIQFGFRKKSPEQRGVLRFASIYGNTGFMGIPLIQAVLGDSAMLIAVTSLVVFNISTWTHGAILLGGKERASVKKALINPGTIGFFLAIAVFASGVKLPSPVINAVSFVGSLNTPLAMIIIGGQMAAVDLKSILKDVRLYISALLKLLVMPMISLLVLLPLGLEPVIVVAVTILAGCPTAGATSIMSEMMGKDASLAARLVTLSTIFCVITLPVVAAIARALA